MKLAEVEVQVAVSLTHLGVPPFTPGLLGSAART